MLLEELKWQAGPLVGNDIIEYSRQQKAWGSKNVHIICCNNSTPTYLSQENSFFLKKQKFLAYL